MKFKISFLPEEDMKAHAVVSMLQPILGRAAKIKESAAHPPYRQIYIITKRPRVDKCQR